MGWDNSKVKYLVVHKTKTMSVPYDCNSNYCPPCNSDLSNVPCTGVIGADQPQQQITSPLYKYGADAQIMGNLRKKDLVPQCGTQDTLGSIDASGTCHPCASTPCPNAGSKMQLTPLVLNDAFFKSLPNDIIKSNYMFSFPLQGLEKIWGDAGGKYNQGVRAENVYVSLTPEQVTCVDSKYNTSTPVIWMEAHGDKYNGGVMGLVREPKTACLPKDTCNAGPPQCTTYKPANDGKRVGGVACTRDQYGPGVYNVLAYVPETSDETKRGYVFAIWPFHYEEIYTGTNDVNTNAASQARGDLSKLASNPIFPCYNQADTDPQPSVKCLTPSIATGDIFSAINHEIDIEIPNNTPSVAWKEHMTWDTMNVNTWVNDINNYDADTGAYYTQVAVTSSAPSTSFISTDKNYHWYTIDWYVDNKDHTNNYVKVYFDSPFDPTGQTKMNNVALPKAPTKPPVHATQRFIPTRAGRLNIGPWMAHWGYGGMEGKSPNFDTVTCKMAHLSIIPYQTGFDFPQTYDQVFQDGTQVKCDFKNIVATGNNPHPGPSPPPPPPYVPPHPNPNPNPNPHSGTSPNIALIVGIVAGSVVLLLCIGLGIWFYVKNHKKHQFSQPSQYYKNLGDHM